VIDRSTVSRENYNRVEIGFRAGDLSLNRNDEYLYTLFVPDRASTAFPASISLTSKGRFTLAVDIPANTVRCQTIPIISSDTADGRVMLRFSETKPISTYLFAFAAGKFELVERG
jgi:aminopeptidase N